MGYTYCNGDERALIAGLGPLFEAHVDPLNVQIAAHENGAWRCLVRPDLQVAGNRLLRLELNEDGQAASNVILTEPRGPDDVGLTRPTVDEEMLWKSTLSAPDLPVALEVLARDLLLATRVDATPANARRVVALYRAVAQIDDDSLHVTLAILRANTIARQRRMAEEGIIRDELLSFAERALTTQVFPGISLRYVGAMVDAPRAAVRGADELSRLRAVLEAVESQHRDISTLGWVASYRVAVAVDDEERDKARRRHVQTILDLSAGDDSGLRAMIWAEMAAGLAVGYGIQDLHDAAVVRMQKLSRTDLGWTRKSLEFSVPSAVLRQRARRTLRLSSWEQALAAFLAGDSPSGDAERNRQLASRRRSGILDLIGGRSFGGHQLPERTHGTANEEHLKRLEQGILGAAAAQLQLDLTALADRFGVPEEQHVVAFLTTVYGASATLVQPWAEALDLFWRGDFSSAARLAIPFIEASSRELLVLMDEPLYRMERGASPGRFPAMDFYVDKLEKLGLDGDWVVALRSALLSGGLNLRNRLAHGFQLHFSASEAALVIRLAGLFVAMPVGSSVIDDERIKNPLGAPRRRVRRRLGWVWS
ncbi:hypothetical protein DEI97_003705 [Curtobacterium sp. MCLR17_032]|uniref:hypothetical protein n=1 Tax=Curtobacterium sp. MCLR17_032 TaxID=2175650 RepID=UPI0011B4ACD5|nr:hypothetical protein [Curtobacterium sp. MCLR17_032]WIE62262.1 hypothetical protein DEI97_003705 [Curtobacterium sp. MCLR17_032]